MVPTRSLTTLIALVAAASLPVLADEHTEWRSYGGDAGNSHYSSLQQINRSNVSELTLAWRYASAAGQPLP
ncbi:MAG: hypothetical protein NWS56_11950, partial [Haliea sp.]|nr:hypothetical protein [Haliea sp.]